MKRQRSLISYINCDDCVDHPAKKQPETRVESGSSDSGVTLSEQQLTTSTACFSCHTRLTSTNIAQETGSSTRSFSLLQPPYDVPVGKVYQIASTLSDIDSEK